MQVPPKTLNCIYQRHDDTHATFISYFLNILIPAVGNFVF